jgi:Mrp family chromosome partitioning ATPase
MICTYYSSYQSLRVMLDVRLPESAMIVVSSALDEDGRSEVASGIARAFAWAGRSTALINLCDGQGNKSLSTSEGEHENFSGLVVEPPELPPHELSKLIADVRLERGVIVVAGPPVLRDSTSLDLCRVAEGVVLAVRLGRKITPEDEATAAQLRRVNANVVGIVAMRPSGDEPLTRLRPVEALKAARSRMLQTLAASHIGVKAAKEQDNARETASARAAN